MIYNTFKDKELSALGLGCMRLPTVNGEYGKIDMDATAEMVKYAMAQGINYYDTAWRYHDGNSESVMGEVLSAYPRESYSQFRDAPGVTQCC